MKKPPLACTINNAASMSNIIGGKILVSAETTYPVKEGAVATVPGGGSPIAIPPTADFVGSPQSGWGSPISGPAPLQVTFIDLSIGGPAAWTWDLSAGSPGGTGTPSVVTPGTSLAKGPHTVTYDCTGSPGDTCVYNVSLNVSNAGGSDAAVKPAYITVTVPPDSGPIAEFIGTPRSGVKPLTVSFQFVDLRGGTVTYTSQTWDLDGDGQFDDGTGPTAAFNYTNDGSYNVSLKVSDGTTTNTLTKTGYINVLRKICTVPDFAEVNPNGPAAQKLWADAGFTTIVKFVAGNWNKIHTQSIVGGTIDPQPDGCDSTITVGP